MKNTSFIIIVNYLESKGIIINDLYSIEYAADLLKTAFDLKLNTGPDLFTYAFDSIKNFPKEISNIKIPNFDKPFYINKNSLISNISEKSNLPLDDLVNQITKPRFWVYSPKLSLYTLPFLLISLLVEPIGNILHNLYYQDISCIEYLYQIAHYFNNVNYFNPLLFDINTTVYFANIPTNNQRDSIPQDPSSSQDNTVSYGQNVTVPNDFFFWDSFFDFQGGFFPSSPIYAGVNIMSGARFWSNRQLVNAILDAVRHSQHYHFNSIRHALELLNGNTTLTLRDSIIIIRENIEELLQYYVNTKIHLYILRENYPETYEKLKNFHYPVFYITQSDWDILIKDTDNFNLLSVMKDILFIIVDNYDNIEDYPYTYYDENSIIIENSNTDIVVSSNETYLIKDYTIESLLETLRIYDNQSIENIIGMSAQELISLISDLKQVEEVYEQVDINEINQSNVITEQGDNTKLNESNEIPILFKKKSKLKKLKDKIKKFFKKLKK